VTDADANRDRVSSPGKERAMNRKSHTHPSTIGSPRFDAFGFDPLTGMRLVPLDPWTCFVDGDGDGDGDDGGDKTFTQADVDRIVKKRIAKAEKESASLAKKLDSATSNLETLTTKFDELQTKFDSTNKSDVEKELAKLQRQVAKMESDTGTLTKERDEANALALQAVAGLNRTKLEAQLRDALRGQKAHGKGMDQAVALMLGEGAKFDEDGVFGMTIDDVPYDKPADAAKKWLEQNSHFQEGSGGGSGTPRPGGNGKLLNEKAMDDMSPASLVSTGLSMTPKVATD
jgi:hypothetical protein